MLSNVNPPFEGAIEYDAEVLNDPGGVTVAVQTPAVQSCTELELATLKLKAPSSASPKLPVVKALWNAVNASRVKLSD